MSRARSRWPAAQRIAGLLLAAAAIATLATQRGRAVSTGDFLLLRSVFLPAAGLAGVSAWLRPTPSRRAWLGPVMAASGAIAAFVAGRVLSTFWLLVGRGLALDVPFLAAAAAALVALVAGCVLVAAGTDRVDEEARSRARWCLFGLVAVPLIPWLLIVGEGVSVVVFNDLTAGAFSEFPVRPRMAAGLWAVAAGIGLAGVAATLRETSVRVDRWGTSAGVLAVAMGYGVYGWQTWVLNGEFPPGLVLPLANYVPLLSAIVAGLGVRGAESDEVAFEPR